MTIEGFVLGQCIGARQAGQYIHAYAPRPFPFVATPFRCPFCEGALRHYPGVIARAAEDAEKNVVFYQSKTPVGTRVLRCDNGDCCAVFSTAMTDRELLDSGVRGR